MPLEELKDVEDLVTGKQTCTSSNRNTAQQQQHHQYPCVPMYGPVTVRNLIPGSVHLWCSCGLSKKQPWCDGSHRGTSFQPLRWTVPKKEDGTGQTIYSICNCKYTSDPPYCDAIPWSCTGSRGRACPCVDTKLPLQVLQRQQTCPDKDRHDKVETLCTSCGYSPHVPNLLDEGDDKEESRQKTTPV